MPFFRLKRSFTSGELDSILDARVDLDRYKTGCKQLRNMYILPQGPVRRRSGMKFVADFSAIFTAVGGFQDVKIVEFSFDETQSYCIILVEGVTTERIYFAYNTGLIADPVTPTNPYYITTADSWSDATCDTTDTDETVTMDDTSRVRVGAAVTGTGIPADTVVVEVTDSTTIELNNAATATNADVSLSFSYDWGFDVSEMYFAQSGDIIFITQANQKPLELKRLGHDDWKIEEAYFTDQPEDWDDTNGWPTKVSFFEQRSVFASNGTKKRTLWFSESGNLYSFAVSSPQVESDACTFTLGSGQQNKIQWLSSARNLLVGTLGDEFAVSGQGSPLSYSSISATRQTNQGGETLPPIMVGPATLFIERLGRSVVEFIYDYTYDSYKATDITMLAPHFTREYSITDWAFQQTPNGIVWCVRSDGVLLGLTYQREHKVVGWHMHTTDGTFLSVASTPNSTNREDDVWFMVKRTINGSDKYYLEKFAPEFNADDTTEAYFLDSFLEYDGVSTSTISGLGHLEGETVSILADGAVQADKVVASGQITLDTAATQAVVGLAYTSTLQIYPLDIELKDGTTLGRTKRITNLTVLLDNSLGMKMGREQDGLEEQPFRVPADLTGTAVPLFSGPKKCIFPEGFEEQENVFVVQEQPLPLTVLGTVEEIEIYS
jgi:hypothetical protein